MMFARSGGALLMLGLVATSAALKTQPVSDTMETIGDTAGSVQDTVGGAGQAVGADKVVDGTEKIANRAAGAVGGVANGVGANPEKIQKVPIVGSSFQVNAMSTSLSCVINLTLQYMIVYTALAIVRCFNDYLNIRTGSTTITETLEQAALTVNYAPMLACLFLACRMRVNWLTQGKGNPPTYVQVWMLCATYAVLLMTLVAFVIPIFTGEKIEVDEDTGDIKEGTQPFKNWIMAIGFTVLKYLVMIGLYIGVLCIIYGTVNYEPPKGSWPGDVIPPPAPAVSCTMILTCMYFLVYAFIQIGKTSTSFVPSFTYINKITGALQGAICTMAFAPMLSILFIGARMRALQMDPVNGMPQTWAQNCFYACTYAVMIQCILAVAVPLVLGGTIKKGQMGEGDVEYEVGDYKLIATILTVLRYIVMFSVYLGFTAVIWSVFTIQHPEGPEYTPPISVTMQCVINLTVQYFTVYLMIWVCVTVKEFTGWDWSYLTNTMENAKGTIAFCPMLAILFVGVRMRALRLTNNRGAPQGWVQDGMYMATWSILIQFFMVLLIPVATFIMSGGAEVHHAKVDSHGNTRWQPGEEHKDSMFGKILLLVVEVVRWLGLLLLYGGTVTVIVGAIMMTPETANGRGALPLVRQTPIGNEPKGANDIPGVPQSSSQ